MIIHRSVTKMKTTAVFVGLLLVVTSVWQFTDARRCRPGFVKYSRSCYWVSPKRMIASWADAQIYCRVMHSYLIDITSAREQNFIRSYLRRKSQNADYWIGANDEQVEGHFRWMSTRSRRPIRYTNWAHLEPNNQGGAENCVIMRYKTGFQWNDVPCDVKKAFICEQY